MKIYNPSIFEFIHGQRVRLDSNGNRWTLMVKLIGKTIEAIQFPESAILWNQAREEMLKMLGGSDMAIISFEKLPARDGTRGMVKGLKIHMLKQDHRLWPGDWLVKIPASKPTFMVLNHSLIKNFWSEVAEAEEKPMMYDPANV